MPAGETWMRFSQIGFLHEFLDGLLSVSFLSGVCHYSLTTEAFTVVTLMPLLLKSPCDLCSVLSCPLPPEPPPYNEGSV